MGLSFVEELGITRQRFQEIGAADESVRVYNGEPYRGFSTFTKYFPPSLQAKTATLQQLYPYQVDVQKLHRDLSSDFKHNTNNGLVISAVTCFALQNLGARGFVFPFLRKYGRFLSSHRLFRHYLLAIGLPQVYNVYDIKTRYGDLTEQFYQVHANRMKKQILTDPSNTYYPEELYAFPRRVLHQDKIYEDPKVETPQWLIDKRAKLAAEAEE